MKFLLTILDTPILQAIGIVLIIGLAERIGIPLISIIKSLLKINGNGRDEKIEMLNAQLNLIESNHLKEIGDKLDKIIEQNNTSIENDKVNHIKIITLLENR